MLKRDEIINILGEAGVLLEGHFQLTSGRHSDKYLQCAKLFRSSKYSEVICAELAAKFKKDNIELVAGPALGAVIMAYEVARALKVGNAFAERDHEGKMCLRRGFSIEEGQRVLVVEDVVTTGGSVKEVIKIIEDRGGVVAGIGCVADRSGGKIDFGYNFKSVLEMEVQSWLPHECPLCAKGGAAVKPGSRK